MNIVEKEFVSFEVALEMKKLNFDEPCLAAYRIEFTKGVASGFLLLGKDPSHLTEQKRANYILGYGTILAPTIHQAFKWFRAQCGLFVQPNRTILGGGIWYYFSISSRRTDVCEGSFSYEEAEAKCLEKLIEIINNE